METKGMKALEEKLRECQGGDAVISISHKIYGDQKIKCQLDYIFDKERVGFRVRSGQEIFVYKNDFCHYGIKDGIYFADDVMEVKIKMQ